MHTWLEKLYIKQNSEGCLDLFCISLLAVAKSILKHLKGTNSVGLWYTSYSLINLLDTLILILILQDVSLIGKVKVEHAVFLDQASYLGIARNKHV